MATRRIVAVQTNIRQAIIELQREINDLEEVLSFHLLKHAPYQVLKGLRNISPTITVALQVQTNQRILADLEKALTSLEERKQHVVEDLWQKAEQFKGSELEMLNKKESIVSKLIDELNKHLDTSAKEHPTYIRPIIKTLGTVGIHHQISYTNSAIQRDQVQKIICELNEMLDQIKQAKLRILVEVYKGTSDKNNSI